MKGVCQGNPITAPPFSPPVSGCRGDPLADAGGVVELRVFTVTAIMMFLSVSLAIILHLVLILAIAP